ncbi:PKD domain-containing protein, partial [archaeon]|nr:PKD domain-containing protein [archaeon]
VESENQAFITQGDGLIFPCFSNQDCGELPHSHLIETTTLTGTNKLTIKTIPGGTCQKIEIYLGENDEFHQILEVPITNPEEEQTLSIKTSQTFNQILLYMPEGQENNSQTVTIITESTQPEKGVKNVLGTEQCNNGIGYSIGYEPASGNPNYCNSGQPDCCSWYQYQHIHDLQQDISQPVSLYIEYKTGWNNGCQDTLTVYTSLDNQTWQYAGEIDTLSQDGDGVPGYPESWLHRTFAINNYSQPFRFVKTNVSSPYQGTSCFLDYSHITITDQIGNQIPIAAFTAPIEATVGEEIIFDASASFDPDGTITSYKWQFGDSTETTTNPTITHIYTEALTYPVNLIVTDDENAQNWTTQPITILPIAQNPQVTINHPLNNTYHQQVTMLNFTAIDDQTIILTCNYSIDGNWNQTTTQNGTETSIAITTGEGEHTAEILCSDGTLWSNLETTTFYVDLTPPTIEITEPANNTHTNSSLLTYNSSDNYGINHYEISLDGNWTNNGMATTYTFNMTENNHTLCAKAVDLVGRETATCIEIAYDITAPDANIYSPANNATIYTTIITLEYNSSFNDIAYSEYKIDNGSWQTDDGSPTTITLSEGWHTVYVRNIDHAGNTGPEDNITIRIIDQNLAPIATILFPEDDEYYLNITYFAFKAIDDTATTLLCNYSLDGEPWQQINATNDTEVTLPLTAEEDGWYQLELTCYDGVNWSNIVEHDFYIDTTPPVLSITSPANHSYVQEAIFTYEGIDAGVGLDYYLVKADDGTWIQTNEETYSFNLSDGQHWLYLKAVDNFGHESNELALNITVDTVNPSIWLYAPVNNTNTSGNVIAIYYISYDSDMDHYEVKQGNGQWINKGATASHIFYNLSEGVNYLYAKVVDHAGNEDISYITANINTEGPDTTITSPANGSYFDIDDVNVSFYSNASDLVTFQYSFDGAEWRPTEINADPDVIYTYEIENVPDGNTTIYVRGKDTANNYGAPDIVNVEIDSLFTNLDVYMIAPDDINQYGSYNVIGGVTNYNEEDIGFAIVYLGLAFNDSTCHLESGVTNPRPLDIIEAGTSEDTSWAFHCNQPGTVEATVTMNYTVDGRTKNTSDIIIVNPV